MVIPVPAKAVLTPKRITPLTISPSLSAKKFSGRQPPPLNPQINPQVPTSVIPLQNLESLCIVFSFNCFGVPSLISP